MSTKNTSQKKYSSSVQTEKIKDHQKKELNAVSKICLCYTVSRRTFGACSYCLLYYRQISFLSLFVRLYFAQQGCRNVGTSLLHIWIAVVRLDTARALGLYIFYPIFEIHFYVFKEAFWENSFLM